MNAELVDRVVNAVLYEGYLLYPYRTSSIKNRFRWTFGVLYPQGWGSESSSLHAEVLVRGKAPRVSVELRYLTLSGGDAEEQRVTTECHPAGKRGIPSQVAGDSARSARRGMTRGEIRTELAPIADDLAKVIVDVENTATVARDATRDEALASSLIAAHLLITTADGELLSLLEDPAVAEQCTNRGVFPVLVGEEGAHDAVLASAIILYDYPRIAAQSPGDLFDGTEIDEILSLRIRTLTDGEKDEIRAQSDARARRLLERTDALSSQEMAALHGTMRPAVCAGDRVRLRPKRRADIFDMALDGMTAIVDAVEVDFEDRTYIAVLVDDDPGADLGALRQIGHRFFFSPDEVEPL